MLHCIERYETFMRAAAAHLEGEGFQRDVERRVRLYRERLSTDRLFPWPLCGQLALDLDHLQYTVELLAYGRGLPLHQRVLRRFRSHSRFSGIGDLLDAIHGAKLAVSKVVDAVPRSDSVELEFLKLAMDGASKYMNQNPGTPRREAGEHGIKHAVDTMQRSWGLSQTDTDRLVAWFWERS